MGLVCCKNQQEGSIPPARSKRKLTTFVKYTVDTNMVDEDDQESSIKVNDSPRKSIDSNSSSKKLHVKFSKEEATEVYKYSHFYF